MREPPGWLSYLVGSSLRTKTVVNVEVMLGLRCPFTRLLCHLLFNLCLLFPIQKMKRVIVEARGNAHDITRKEVQLVLAWQAKTKHPHLRFSKFRLGYWLVTVITFHVGRRGVSGGGDAIYLRNGTAGRVWCNSEDVGGAII